MIEFKLIYGDGGFETAQEFLKGIFSGEKSKNAAEDSHNADAWHIIGTEKGKIIAYGRMYSEKEGFYRIDRVAVSEQERGQYVGDTVMKALEDKAVRLLAAETGVLAPNEVRGFFISEGYLPFVGAADGAVEMRKDLTKPPQGCRGGCRI